LAPEYSKASTNLKLRGSPVKLAKVDATVQTEIAKKFSIQGYPTLKFFRWDSVFCCPNFLRSGEASEYNGGRTEPEIVSWVTKKSSPVSTHLKTQDVSRLLGLFIHSQEYDAFISGSTTRIVAYLQSTDVQTWLKVASNDKFDGLAFAHITDSDLYGDRVQGTVEVYRDGKPN
jgi:protein disulfide-isomerase A1